MIISHQKRFIMMSPWKTASQTMALRLGAYNESPYPSFYHFNPHLNRVVHQHITCAALASLPEGRLGYFLGSFVRNPYDRVYSGFRQVQTDFRHQPHETYLEPWIRDHVMRQLSENFAQVCQAHFDFDEWVDSLTEEQIYEVGRNTSLPLHPAHYWTHVAGRQAAEFIGRVENFEADFREFLSRVEIDEVPSENANVAELDGGAPGKPFGYRYVDRMSPRSIDRINHLFERDFDLFGYERIGSWDRPASALFPAPDEQRPRRAATEPGGHLASIGIRPSLSAL